MHFATTASNRSLFFQLHVKMVLVRCKAVSPNKLPRSPREVGNLSPGRATETKTATLGWGNAKLNLRLFAGWNDRSMTRGKRNRVVP